MILVNGARAQACTINELCSAKYTAQLVDETGAGFGAVTSLTLTLFDKASLAIINSRNQQNVLNQNQVTFDTGTGQLAWTLLPEDNPILDDSLRTEDHRALFTATWGTGTKRINHEVTLKVRNLRRVP